MSVPATRSLANVLRRAGGTVGAEARLLVCEAGPPLPAGAEANAYVNLLIRGEPVRVPRLHHADVPDEGEVAYVLATDNFLLYLGAVATT